MKRQTKDQVKRHNMSSENGRIAIRRLVNMALSGDDLFAGGISPMDAELQNMGFTSHQSADIEVGLYRIICRIAKNLPIQL
jgi:hypothetical protein